MESNYGISYWAKVALLTTIRAAHAKDYTLTRKADRRLKEIAQELCQGRGYIIATDDELERMYPELFKAGGAHESRKFIWAISYARLRRGRKMCFLPVR